MSGSIVAWWGDLSGGSYATAGVDFDGSTNIETTGGFTCTDNPTISWSFWFLCASATNTPAIFYGHEGGNVVSVSISPTNGIVAALNSDGAANVTAHTSSVTGSSWRHCLGSADVSTETIKIYIDNVDVTAGITGASGSGNLTMNGHRLRIATNPLTGFHYTGSLAQLWIAPGVSLLSAGDIPSGTRAKFISGGRPVNLGATGAIPTGTAPAAFLDRVLGDAASVFGTNKGTGGTFTTVGGSLTASATNP